MLSPPTTLFPRRPVPALRPQLVGGEEFYGLTRWQPPRGDYR